MGLGTAIDFPRSVGLCYITKSSLLEGRQGDTGEIISPLLFPFGVVSSNETEPTGPIPSRTSRCNWPGPERQTDSEPGARCENTTSR